MSSDNVIETLPLEYPIAFYCSRKMKYLKISELFESDCDEKAPSFPFFDQVKELNEKLAEAIMSVTICAYCRYCTPISMIEKVIGGER